MFKPRVNGGHFRERVVTEFASKGLRFFEERIWSSSLQREDLHRVRVFLKTHGFLHIDAERMLPRDDSTSRIRWSRHYQKDGQCIVRNHASPIYANSAHLKLTFGYESEEARKECQDQSLVVANALRLLFGVSIARELIFVSQFSDANLMNGPVSDLGFASSFDIQNINRFKNPPVEEAELIRMPEEAAMLLDKAFAQTFPQEQFVLMWLAFETIIHSRPGNGTNGDKRKKFFLKELGSSIVNQEVLRLFHVRCDAFKEGKLRELNFDQECWALYAVLQVAIMKDCPQRKSFLSGLENKLQQNTQA